MKCKVCESELRLGTKRCPHCGTEVPPAGKNSAEVFKWNVQDFPKPKKKTEMSIDWNEGKIYNKQSGRVYSQSSNMWSEPEEVKTLFNFDKKNEEFQQVLDKQMDSIESIPVPEPVKTQEPMVFDLPSSMDMGLFEDLINDDVEIRREGSTITFEIDDPVIYSEPEPQQEPVQEPAPKSESAASTVTGSDGSYVSLEDLFKKEEKNAAPAEEISEPAPAAEDSSADTPEAEKAPAKEKVRKSDEELVFDGIKKLMAAEEKLKQDMERVTYLTPAEAEKAEKIEDDSNKLRFVPPTIEFRSIEDEYAAYRAENSIAKAAAEQNKEVNIEINEPSGTKVTVKTQEIPAPSTVDEDFKTQEVQLDSLKQGPTNVQVSVEVASAAGNASVEVTRNHDGSTVVNIAEEQAEVSEAEPAQAEEIQETAKAEEITVSDDSSADTSEEAVTDISELAELDTAKTESEEFWENSDTSNSGVSRMTITDIFGPDARRIIAGDDEDDKCLEDSLILDIKPEDIAVTKEQTLAIETPAEEAAPSVEEAAVAVAAAAAAEKDAETDDQPEEVEPQETQPAEEPAPESIEEIYQALEESKKSGFGKGAKAVIAILVLILLIELSVIGIKLFAPDTQAALFIERVQDTVVSLFDGEDADTDTNADADDTQDDAQQTGQPVQQTNPTQQPADPANTGAQPDPAAQPQTGTAAQ